MRPRRSTIAAASALAAVLASCDGSVERGFRTQKTGRVTVSLTNAPEQQQLKNSLVSAKIPHEVTRDPTGKEVVSWDLSHDSAVQEIKTKLFGGPLPPGRHIRFEGELGETFKAWLTQQGIPFSIQVSHGTEFVVWSAEDSARVAEWSRFPKDYWKNATPNS